MQNNKITLSLHHSKPQIKNIRTLSNITKKFNVKQIIKCNVHNKIKWSWRHADIHPSKEEFLITGIDTKFKKNLLEIVRTTQTSVGIVM